MSAILLLNMLNLLNEFGKGGKSQSCLGFYHVFTTCLIKLIILNTNIGFYIYSCLKKEGHPELCIRFV